MTKIIEVETSDGPAGYAQLEALKASGDPMEALRADLMVEMIRGIEAWLPRAEGAKINAEQLARLIADTAASVAATLVASTVHAVQRPTLLANVGVNMNLILVETVRDFAEKAPIIHQGGRG